MEQIKRDAFDCIIGNEGSSVFGAWSILGSNPQHIPSSAALMLTSDVLFFLFMGTTVSWKCNFKCLEIFCLSQWRKYPSTDQFGIWIEFFSVEMSDFVSIKLLSVCGKLFLFISMSECVSMQSFKMICISSFQGIPLLSSVSACNKRAYCCVLPLGPSWAPPSLVCLSGLTHTALIYIKFLMSRNLMKAWIDWKCDVLKRGNRKWGRQCYKKQNPSLFFFLCVLFCFFFTYLLGNKQYRLVPSSIVYNNKRKVNVRYIFAVTDNIAMI